MSEHEQISSVFRDSNQRPLEIDPATTALIVVDMQRYFTRPGYPFTDLYEKINAGSASGYLKRVEQVVIPAIQQLLGCFRDLSSPVVYTAVCSEKGDGTDLPPWLRAFDELGRATLGVRIWPAVGDPSCEIDDALAPRPGELVLNKLSAGTFASTGLDQRLRLVGVESVVVTGVATDVCVSTTAREAADRGYRTVVVSDACTTLSEQLHTANLESLQVFGQIRSASDVVSHLRRPAGAA